MAMGATPSEGPLGELAILDFSRILAGPFATMMMADLGATVTKVERPGTGDETRSWGPPFDEYGMPTYFQAINRNKRSILPDLPGYDLLVQALGGLMSITGEPDGEPQKVGVALVDVLAGLFATVGILAALRHRDATGEGQLVEVNLLQALLAGLVNQASAFTIAGVVGARLGNAHPSISPYELYETGDGEVVVAVGNERQFAALCEVIGAPELATDARFATNGDRVANREVLRAELLARLATPPASHWARELTAVRVP